VIARAIALSALLYPNPPTAAQAPLEIPASAQRAKVVQLDKNQIRDQQASTPASMLADGFHLSVAALHPLVTHPIMACLDDRGRLFVGDGVGVNWNKAQLEANPPNRVLMLEDSDGDGAFDRSTVFADQLTFPQGACWFQNALYVCSPPGLWRFNDTDRDGVADQREMLVDGFDYTGNAADVHGPFLNPLNQRLYWCHGRKGHKVTGKDGIVVHEGLASGIWSCNPDGTDVRWHSLGCGDNPVEVDFTPEGDILGVQNLYHSNPRGDTLMHYLLGGVYERPDMLKAIEGLPRTLERMPVVHNFGHVAVSGCALWRSYSEPAGPLQMLVTHFNTGRLSRMELTRSGASYHATENELLKLQNPDAHLTDVLEDADGSLLVLNTGGWFRIGCPSSLMAKPDITGAIYRISRDNPRQNPTAKTKQAVPSQKSTAAPEPSSPGSALESLTHPDPHRRRKACEWIALHQHQSPGISKALINLLGQPLDPALEHAAMYAAGVTKCVRLSNFEGANSTTLLRRLLIIQDQFQSDSAAETRAFEIALSSVADSDAELARAALGIINRHTEHERQVTGVLNSWLNAESLTATKLAALRSIASDAIAKPGMRAVIAKMLNHAHPKTRLTGLQVIASQTTVNPDPEWITPLQKALQDPSLGTSPVIDAIKRVKHQDFDEALQAICDNAQQPLALRLKTLSAIKSVRLSEQAFSLLIQTLSESSASVSARLEAASLIKDTPLSSGQITMLLPVLSTAGPLELKALTGIFSKVKDTGVARQAAEALAKNPAISSQQESVYRTALSAHPPELFELILLPALQKANAQHEAKMFSLAPLADRLASGIAERGQSAFESGKGACVACHRIGQTGRSIGPDLSKIGSIRTGRDLLESIIFPSNTLARDYEAHAIETSDGTSVTGVVRGHSAEGLLVVDAAGQEVTIAHQKIISNTTLSSSLMPAGLDTALGEKDLIDLVSYLQSLK
jgi:putative membrane-bound dehydrogenase-like protein